MHCPTGWTPAVFSKHLKDFSLEELAVLLPESGIRSLDLVVRPDGHVRPDQVESELPRCHELLSRAGIGIAMITTDITDPGDPLARRILRTASALGITHYKIGYYRYAGFGTLREQRRQVAAALRGLSEINGEYGIRGGYHNHSNTFFGASPADIAAVLEDLPAEWIGVYFDPAHAVIEGGTAAWEMGMDLVSNRIIMLSVKDFCRVGNKSGVGGGRQSSVKIHPLEGGEVPWDRVLANLCRCGFAGPISVHGEYGSAAVMHLDSRGVLRQVRRDWEFFLACLAALPELPG